MDTTNPPAQIPFYIPPASPVTALPPVVSYNKPSIDDSALAVWCGGVTTALQQQAESINAMRDMLQWIARHRPDAIHEYTRYVEVTNVLDKSNGVPK